MRVKSILAGAVLGVVTAVQAVQVDPTGSNQPVPLVDKLLLAQVTAAARNGDAKSQLILGDAYLLGDGGLAKSPGEAMALYQKAASQGYTPAQRRLGYVYSKGDGIERDDAMALHWYRAAAELGDSHAQRIVGLMYGIQRNKQEAYFWSLLATRNGNKDAMRARDYDEAQLTQPERAAVRARVAKWRPKKNETPSR